MNSKETAEQYNQTADAEAIMRAARLAPPTIILANMDMQGRVLSYDHVRGGHVDFRTNPDGTIQD